MKAKELIDLISKHWKDDEDVTFLTYDDQGEWLETDVRFRIHNETIQDGHYEGLNATTDKWERISYDDRYRIIYSKWRFIDYGTKRTNQVKVLEIR